jgi:hypothetical protein
MPERPIRINVEGMPGLAPLAPGKYHDDGTYPVTRSVLGVPHVFIDDRDVTYLRGERAVIQEWTLVEPGGEDTAVVGLPQVSPFDTLGETGGELDFIGADRDLEIVIVGEGATPGVFDGTQHSVWNGILVSDETHTTEDSVLMEWHAKGLLIGQASAQQHRVVNVMPPTDIGTVIPAALNALASRRFNPIAAVTTGIMTRERGAETDKVWDYVQDLLSTAWTDDGRQWTIERTGPRSYALVLKDNTTIDYTIEAGTRGVSASLSRDASQKYNVIWARGVGPDGYAWRGMVYPDFLLGAFDADALNGAFRRPLIWDPKVSDGRWEDDGLPAAEYDPNVEMQATELNFPVGIIKDVAYLDAQRQLARDENAGVTGTITMRTDPGEGARFLMPAGANLSYRNFRGGDFATGFAPFLLRAAQVRVNLPDHEVTLTVDSRQRDAMTLSSIIERDREASLDPARRPGNVNRRSRQEPDLAIEFDGECGGHIVPVHSVPGGVWKVFPRPLSQVNRIVKIDYHATVRYALVLFGAEVTPAFLATNIGNPLASDDPLAPHIDALEAAGLIEGWGKQGDALGYWPGQQSTGASFNGKFIETNTIEYVSAHPPWVWVCEWAEVTGNMSGFIYPAVNT